MRHCRPFLNLDKCRTEAASAINSGWFVSPIARDKCVAFCNPNLNRSREILPEAVGGVIFGRFSVEPPAGSKIW